VLRAAVSVRVAGLDDLAALRPLWDECRELAGAALVAGGVSEVAARVRAQIQASADRVAEGGTPTYRVVYAVQDAVPLGFASLSLVERALLTPATAVLVDVLHVSAGRRKNGVGTALLREAVAFADEVGAGDVVVNVLPQVRDVNRFFARAGFAPLVVRRTAPVGQLRRKLGVDHRLDPRDTTTDLTPVQRTLRRRALLTPRRPGQSSSG
jgi:GNAT superfamily N-acetyltransferase